MNLPDRRSPLLFDRFPGLAGRIPWMRLVPCPTPVHRLEAVSARFGHEVWIKRDDLTSPEYGGNKPRKLEFLLARAAASDKRVLLTGGGIGSNHALATAYFGRQQGFQVILDLCRQPVTEHACLKLRLFQALGARMHYVGGQSGFAVRHILAGRLRHPDVFFIPPGGSDFTGTLGYVEAGLEIAGQIERKEMPVPETVFIALGSGGSMAGLVLGLKIGGIGSRVVGVRVATPLAANTWRVTVLARLTARGLRRIDSFPRLPAIVPSDAPVVGDQYGAGYGHATPAGREAAGMMLELEGIRLDPTYTAKAFAALLGHIRAGAAEGPVLFLNTYSAQDLAGLAESMDSENLPAVFRRFVEVTRRHPD
ncbi:MAG: pyridoxal-phosphate dependent enzyme [Proteobacteria bacterium]|nr:pyridoxal-phosphate dependent enzyme [Pseudomonadota bacterium]